MKSLIKEQNQSYVNAKVCYIFKEKFKNRHFKDKKYCKVWFEIIVIIQENIKVLRVAYVIQNVTCLKKFLQFFIIDQTDYHFMIKKSAEDF